MYKIDNTLYTVEGLSLGNKHTMSVSLHSKLQLLPSTSWSDHVGSVFTTSSTCEKIHSNGIRLHSKFGNVRYQVE